MHFKQYTRANWGGGEVIARSWLWRWLQKNTMQNKPIISESKYFHQMAVHTYFLCYCIKPTQQNDGVQRTAAKWHTIWRYFTSRTVFLILQDSV